MFSNSDYDISDQSAGREDPATACMGNPDVKPEKTVQYEIGYKQAIDAETSASI